jgi:hypothetical protein
LEEQLRLLEEHLRPVLDRDCPPGSGPIATSEEKEEVERQLLQFLAEHLKSVLDPDSDTEEKKEKKEEKKEKKRTGIP